MTQSGHFPISWFRRNSRFFISRPSMRSRKRFGDFLIEESVDFSLKLAVLVGGRVTRAGAVEAPLRPDPTGSGRHHQNAIGQVNCLTHRVSDKDHSALLFLPDSQQFSLQKPARESIKGAASRPGIRSRWDWWDRAALPHGSRAGRS